MMKKLVTAAAVLIASTATVSAQGWTPPIGIPTPGFGITQTAPARPNPWVSEVAGFYYIDESASSSTDSGNTYGYPGRPRRTIPTSIPAGSVVEVHGTYTRSHVGGSLIRANGTAAAPVYIRGESLQNAPTITRPMHTQGSYYIVENLRGILAAGVSDNIFKFISPTNRGVLRHTNLRGNLVGGGVSLQYNANFGGGTVSNVVVWDNEIYSNGDVNSSSDEDQHAISIGGLVDTTWIIDNVLHDSSGDGLQINAGSLSSQATTHHIYVGGNHVYRTRQAGLFAKQSVDVIFSQNIVHDIIDTSWSRAKGLGFQYAPERVWFIYNRVYNTIYGIYSGSDSGLGNGRDTYMIGNVIYNTHETAGAGYSATSAWEPAAIMLAGGINRYIVNNTIYNSDAGIHVPSAGGALVIENNVISGVSQSAGAHVFVEFGAVASASTIRNNAFGGSLRLKWGNANVISSLASFQSSTGKGSASVNADPQFVNAPAADFHLSSGSPARDSAVASTVYERFRQLYGLNIDRDIEGAVRPQGNAFDMGAFEYGSGSGSGGGGSYTAPPAPSNLRILP